jgi:hypothetical protein
MKRSKYYVRWAWRSGEFMHVRTTAFCITRNMLTWMSALSVGHQDTKRAKSEGEGRVKEGRPSKGWCGIFPIAERMKRMFANKE